MGLHLPTAASASESSSTEKKSKENNVEEKNEIKLRRTFYYDYQLLFVKLFQYCLSLKMFIDWRERKLESSKETYLQSG